MKVKFTVNNYMLGAKVKSTPTDKIVSQERIDTKHTEIVYEITDREKQFCEKVLVKKGEVIEYDGTLDMEIIDNELDAAFEEYLKTKEK